MKKVYETEKLILKVLDKSYAELVVDYYLRNKSFLEEWGAFLSCHLGYKLDKDEINKGYITEAIQKGIEVMFNEFGLHRIEANIMPKNKRSLRVVEKLGFYNEGLAYKYLKINDKWEDHIHMVLLNDNV
jgi:[ribosomal protein S5]-alanine N-acetyltransferase